MPKSQRSTQDFVGSLPLPLPTAQHLLTFGVTTATDNQSSSSNTGPVMRLPKPGYQYQSQRLQMANSEAKRHQYGKKTSVPSKMPRPIREHVLYANYGKWLTNASPFLKLFAIPFVLFCSLPGSNISACFSPSHAWHALMDCF